MARPFKQSSKPALGVEHELCDAILSFQTPPPPSKCVFKFKNNFITVLVKLQVTHLVTTHQFLDQILPEALIDKLNNARQVAIEMKRRELSLLKEEIVGMPHVKPNAGIHIRKLYKVSPLKLLCLLSM